MTQNTRSEYIEDCRRIVREHFDSQSKRMLVNYVRAKRSRPIEGCNAAQTQAIRGILNSFGDTLSVAVAQRLLEPILSGEDSFKDEAAFNKAFTSVRRNWRSRRSPIVGVVISINTGPSETDAVIGWSMCHPNDKFSRHVGIRKAIDHAESVRVVQKNLMNNKSIPHTMVPAIHEMMDRASRIYNKK